MHANLTLVSNAFPTDSEAVAWAFRQVLSRKALVLESLLGQRRASGRSPEVAATWDQGNRPFGADLSGRWQANGR